LLRTSHQIRSLVKDTTVSTSSFFFSVTVLDHTTDCWFLARSDRQSSIAKSKNKKKASAPRPGRLGAETVWSPAPASSARPASLAWVRRTSGVQRQIGPLHFRPKFNILSVKKQKKIGDVPTHATPIKKRQTTLACRPFCIAVALPCGSGVVYRYFDMFFVSFLYRDSVLPPCPHSVPSTRF
jgi:hypothetical protein